MTILFLAGSTCDVGATKKKDHQGEAEKPRMPSLHNGAPPRHNEEGKPDQLEHPQAGTPEGEIRQQPGDPPAEKGDEANDASDGS